MKETETAVASAKPAPTTMVKVSENDDLAVWSVGEGTPVVFIHGAFFGSLMKPLAESLAAQGPYQAIWYQRRGYNGKPTEPVSVPEQALDVVKVLDALGIDKAHVVGHSAGGIFAMALAMEAPERVSSAAFFDCILGNVKSVGMLLEMAKPAIAKAQKGDMEGAAAEMLAGLGCTKEMMDERMPGSWSELTEGSRTWFHTDAPVINQWVPDGQAFEELDVPMAWMETGGFPPIHETGELLRSWQPGMTVLQSPTEQHFFPVLAPEESAAVIDGWIQGQHAP